MLSVEYLVIFFFNGIKIYFIFINLLAKTNCDKFESLPIKKKELQFQSLSIKEKSLSQSLHCLVTMFVL